MLVKTQNYKPPSRYLFLDEKRRLGLVLTVHKHKKINDWISTKKRITMHFTPTYSSWLNQVEIWFNILTKDVLKGGVWRSKKQLVDQIIEYIDTYNKTRAKPFEWTYNGSTN
jgi:putative transposase